MSGINLSYLLGIGVGFFLGFGTASWLIGSSRTEGAGLDNAAAEPCSTGERATEHGIVDPALPAPSVQAQTGKDPA